MKSHLRRRSGIYPVTVAAAVVAVVASACGPSSTARPVAGPGDFGHVHDLVAHDDTVLVATHTGLYHIDAPDRAVLVGDERHDLMSLTRLDTGDLAASGHPDLRLDDYRVEGLPPLLGLVVSGDEGETWESVALLGEADFHALSPASEGLYAAESSGTIWFFGTDPRGERRGTLEARDLAAAPQAADDVVAIGFDGSVWTSSDGARSWAALEAAPRLVEIEWPETDMLVGLDTDGTVWTAQDHDGPWSRVADGPDNAEAFLVTDSSWFVAISGGRIARSEDAGQSWVDDYTPPTE